MDTQNTPIHFRVWRKDFWRLAVAGLLLGMSVYMLVPVLPALFSAEGLSPLQSASAMGIFGIGIFFLGAFTSFLVLRFRRNQVCMLAILGIIAMLAALCFVDDIATGYLRLAIILAARFFMGSFYGLALMVLVSTLLLDTVDSFSRSEANYMSMWVSRCSLALGPLAGLLVSQYLEASKVYWAAAGAALLAMLLIRLVKFPFRTPVEDERAFSFDRFFLPRGILLFINLSAIMAIIGLLLTRPLDITFYIVMFAGMVLALLAERFAFANANLKSEVISGLLLIIAALLIGIVAESHKNTAADNAINQYHVAKEYIIPLFFGFGMSIICSRFLGFFIKLSDHCQRGTSISTYFLAVEFGISLGIFVGIGDVMDNINGAVLSLVIAVATLLLYNFWVHPWFMKHKNR